MALLYALLAACATLIVIAYQWRYAMIPALVCVGIVAYVAHENQPSAEPKEYKPEGEELSAEELPPYMEIVRTETLGNGAEITILRKNYSLMFRGDGSEMTVSVPSTCTLYRDPETNSLTALYC